MNAIYLQLCLVVFQSNFATINEESGVVTSRRADRHFEEPGPILCAALNGLKLPSFPEYTVSVRCVSEFTFWSKFVVRCQGRNLWNSFSDWGSPIWIVQMFLNLSRRVFYYHIFYLSTCLHSSYMPCHELRIWRSACSVSLVCIITVMLDVV